MKKQLPYLVLLISMLIQQRLLGQIEMSNPTAAGRAGVASTLLSDYQCVGINPANLAHQPEFKKRNFSLGLGEFGFCLFSNALNKLNLSDALFDPNRKLSRSEKQQAAKDFSSKALTANLDFLYGGLSWQSDGGKFGFAVTVRERAQWYSKFSDATSELMFNGINARFVNPQTGNLEYYFNKFNVDTSNGGLSFDTTAAVRELDALNISKILDGSRISMSWNREYAFSCGFNVINGDLIRLNFGAGIRFIQGIGYLDLQSKGGTYKAEIAASPGFGIEFPTPSAKDNFGFLPNASGRGVGLEFGTTVEIGRFWTLGASITDIGAVAYNTNVYTASDGPLKALSTKGFSNYNFFQSAEQFDGFTKEMVSWREEKIIRSLPSRVRFGASFSSKIVNVGFDMVAPVNTISGNVLRPVASLGADVKFAGIFRLSSGIMMGGNYFNSKLPFDINPMLPVGLTIRPLGPFYEIGIATRDILTYFRSGNPVISISTGFFRMRI